MIFSRIIGFVMRSVMRGVAEREAALDAGVAVVGMAVAVRRHAHDFDSRLRPTLRR